MTTSCLRFSSPTPLTLCVVLLLTACSATIEQDYPTIDESGIPDSGSVLELFSWGQDEETANTTGTVGTPRGISVNADMWRAALDTIRFMPLSSADPVGGTIISDWYNDPGAAGERVKVNIVITSLDLRADGLRVSIFREKQVNNRWTSVAASAQAARQMENIILTRARDFKIARRVQP